MRRRIWIPEIVVPERKIIVPTPQIGIEGWFDVKLIHKPTGVIKQHLRFKNLITDAALNAIASANPDTLTQYMAVGTGGTAPANSDTTLQTPIGTRIARTDLGFTPGPAYAYYSWKLQGTFLEANANGTLTEIGLFSASAGGTMWTRQLFKDGTGTPTAITKTASDQLQVTYEVRIYPPTVDVTGVVVISGVNYNYTVRAADITAVSRWQNAVRFANFGVTGTVYALETNVLGTTSGIPGGTQAFNNSNSIAAYAAGTFYRDHTYVWEPGSANFATGIGSMLYGSPSASVAALFQVSFSPKIPKDSTKRLTLVVRLSWGRYP